MVGQVIRCPACGAPCDAHTPSPESRREAVPKPGDYSICALCATILRYEAGPDGGLTMRRATAEELLGDDLPPGVHAYAARLARGAYVRAMLRALAAGQRDDLGACERLLREEVGDP